MYFLDTIPTYFLDTLPNLFLGYNTNQFFEYNTNLFLGYNTDLFLGYITNRFSAPLFYKRAVGWTSGNRHLLENHNTICWSHLSRTQTAWDSWIRFTAWKRHIVSEKLTLAQFNQFCSSQITRADNILCRPRGKLWAFIKRDEMKILQKRRRRLYKKKKEAFG